MPLRHSIKNLLIALELANKIRLLLLTGAVCFRVVWMNERFFPMVRAEGS
jgi:hypothetical protein